MQRLVDQARKKKLTQNLILLTFAKFGSLSLSFLITAQTFCSRSKLHTKNNASQEYRRIIKTKIVEKNSFFLLISCCGGFNFAGSDEFRKELNHRIHKLQMSAYKRWSCVQYIFALERCVLLCSSSLENSLLIFLHIHNLTMHSFQGFSLR